MLNAIALNLDSKMVKIVNRACNISGEIRVVAFCDTASDAMSIMEKETIDCFFCDPILSDNYDNGFKFINYSGPLPFVIISSNPNLALKAYEYRNIVDYLVRPFGLNRLKDSIDRLLDEVNNRNNMDKVKYENQTNYVFVNIKKKLKRIDLNDVFYISSKGDYITFFTKIGQYTSYGTLKSLISKLPKDRFIDIHRSFLINLDHVVDIENNSVLIIRIPRCSASEVLEESLKTDGFH